MARGSKALHEHFKQLPNGNGNLHLQGAWQPWRFPSGSETASAHQPQHAHSTNGRHDAAEEGTPNWFPSPWALPHPSTFSDGDTSLRLHFNLAKPWDLAPQLRSQPFSTLRGNDLSAGAVPLPSLACLQARALRHTPKQRRPWFLRTLREEPPCGITVLELARPKTIMKALFSSTPPWNKK